MRISDTWKDFISNFNKLVERQSGQLEIKFEDLKPKDEPIRTSKTIDKPTTFDMALKGLLSVPPEK